MSLSGFRDREDASRQAVRSDVRAWVRGPVSGGRGRARAARREE